MKKNIHLIPNRYLILFICVYLLSACSPAPTPTPFRPPTIQAPLIEPTFIIKPTQQIVVVQPTPVPAIIPTSNPEECINNLNFVEDLTVPDNSTFGFGATIDKQWRVENTGTCNWDSGYRLKHIDGATLGAPDEIALFPARAGTQATIQIFFTAPYLAVPVESAWRAFDPAGNAFGDPIYIKIVVQLGG